MGSCLVVIILKGTRWDFFVLHCLLQPHMSCWESLQFPHPGIFPLPCPTVPLSYWVRVTGHHHLESCSNFHCFPWLFPCLVNVLFTTNIFLIFSNMHTSILPSCKAFQRPNIALQTIQNSFGTCVILSELRTFHSPSSVFLTTPTNPPLIHHSGISARKVYFLLRVFNVLIFVANIPSLGYHSCFLLLIQRLAQISPHHTLIVPDGSFSIWHSLLLSPLRIILCFSHSL